jgi:hypothetical protein
MGESLWARYKAKTVSEMKVGEMQNFLGQAAITTVKQRSQQEENFCRQFVVICNYLSE